VVDRQSETETFVNGRRVSECRLEQGDRISVGETTLLYRQGCEEGNRSPCAASFGC
jgi:hypothetical protein